MTPTLPFIPKDHPDLPDAYGMTIWYVNRAEETFEVASHELEKSTFTLIFVTSDDKWHWVPLSSIQRLEFDKRMSKMVACKEELNRNAS